MRHPDVFLAGLAPLTLLLCGCPPQETRKPLAAISMQEAARIVNRNIDSIGGTLRAVGSVDGHFTTEEGARRSFHADGTLFYHEPYFLRFDLKKLGDRQFLFGSNKEWWWVYSKADGKHFCGRQGYPEDVPANLPVQPDQILDALGLTYIPEEGWVTGPAQRIVDDFQQILFITLDENDWPVIEKEYWLDRVPPRLVRRVIFRDRSGSVEMESRLGQYKPLERGGPLLPHEMAASWPKSDADMRLSVRQWKLVEEVRPGDIQFATPSECLEE
jgi:hypothetical protein